MKTRLTTIISLVAVAAVIGCPAPRAQINLFGDYWENIARAAQQNDAATVRALIANNSNPNQTDEDSRTALHYAAMNGNLSIIAIMVKCGK